jgi:fatty acid desaturase
LISTAAFRRDHLAHHAHVNTQADPDLARKLRRPRDWAFPKSLGALLTLFLLDIAGRGLIDFGRNAVIRLSSVKRVNGAAAARAGFPWGTLLYYALAAAVITVTELWPAVLLLWVVPFFTVVPVLVRIRSIAEHFALPGEHELNVTRNTLCPLWEQVCIAPHGINYHLDHHLFPSVPYYNLPRLHRLLLQIPEYQVQACHAERYIGLTEESVLVQVTAPRSLVAAAQATTAQG